MKKLLITGENSFIGLSLIDWIDSNKYQIEINQLSVRGNEWMSTDLSKYDTILHLAGIAHVSTNPKKEELYYNVNTKLSIEIAKYAKNQGVKHFIFMSSMIVYGSSESGHIDTSTVPNPDNFYGDSKLKAEIGINSLKDENFKVSIIRPPMIYGPGSKGNYNLISRYSNKVPLFPKIENKRSMLYISNLCEFIKFIIIERKEGIFYPQNRDYTCTSAMVKMIADANNKKMYLTAIFNPILKHLKNRELLKKVFANYYYDKEMSKYDFNYQIFSTEESIKLTEVNK